MDRWIDRSVDKQIPIRWIDQRLKCEQIGRKIDRQIERQKDMETDTDKFIDR